VAVGRERRAAFIACVPWRAGVLPPKLAQPQRARRKIPRVPFFPAPVGGGYNARDKKLVILALRYFRVLLEILLVKFQRSYRIVRRRQEKAPSRRLFLLLHYRLVPPPPAGFAGIRRSGEPNLRVEVLVKVVLSSRFN
jgi:hypothetical protein